MLSSHGVPAHECRDHTKGGHVQYVATKTLALNPQEFVSLQGDEVKSVKVFLFYL